MKERGSLTVIYGPMFAGKTTETISRYDSAESESTGSVQAFKPTLDQRYGESTRLWSHKRESIPVSKYDHTRPEQIREILRHGVRLVLIDEVQFAAPGIIGVVNALMQDGRDVVCLGLDLDSDKEPFGQTLTLANEADTVIHKLSTCYECGEEAPFTKATFEKKEQTDVGAADKYVPSCETHHDQ